MCTCVLVRVCMGRGEGVCTHDSTHAQHALARTTARMHDSTHTSMHDKKAHNSTHARTHESTHARKHARQHARTTARTHASTLDGTHARKHARKHESTHARQHARKHTRTNARTHASTLDSTHARQHAHTKARTHCIALRSFRIATRRSNTGARASRVRESMGCTAHGPGVMTGGRPALLDRFAVAVHIRAWIKGLPAPIKRQLKQAALARQVNMSA